MDLDRHLQSILQQVLETDLLMKNSLRDKRKDIGWSQADLAKQLHVSRQTVNAIETGKYDPSLPLAFKIAAVFGVKIDELFFPG